MGWENLKLHISTPKLTNTKKHCQEITLQVEIYRIGKEIEVLDIPNSISGEDVLPDFVLNLEQIW